MIAGDLDGAIEVSRVTADHLLDEGGLVWMPAVTAVLVEALLRRGRAEDFGEARQAVDRLAAAPMEPGLAVRDIFLLRLEALLARSRGDEVAYRNTRNRYRERAHALGFEGHMKYAEAMP
jgi:adenylate cyclase